MESAMFDVPIHLLLVTPILVCLLGYIARRVYDTAWKRIDGRYPMPQMRPAGGDTEWVAAIEKRRRLIFSDRKMLRASFVAALFVSAGCPVLLVIGYWWWALLLAIVFCLILPIRPLRLRSGRAQLHIDIAALSSS